MPVYVRHRPSRCARAGRHRHDGLHPAVADLDPRLRPLSKQDFDLAGIDIVVNTHLHFDHCGGNRLFAGRPSTSSVELDDARSEDDYTIREWVEAPWRAVRSGRRRARAAARAQLVRRRSHTRGMRWSSSRPGSVRSSSAATWRFGSGELDEPHTEGQLRCARSTPSWSGSREHEPWRPHRLTNQRILPRVRAPLSKARHSASGSSREVSFPEVRVCDHPPANQRNDDQPAPTNGRVNGPTAQPTDRHPTTTRVNLRRLDFRPEVRQGPFHACPAREGAHAAMVDRGSGAPYRPCDHGPWGARCEAG
jgi:N-acyl homoserine lactone hydrolase